MATTLILGANRGIGLGLAQEFLERGWRVIATARDPEGAIKLRKLGAQFPGHLGVHRLDVTDDDAVRDLAAQLEWDSIDLFVHNAGVYGPRLSGVEEIDPAVWLEVLRVNTIAPYQTARAFSQQVARSKGRRMVFLTSRMGSIEDNASGGSYVYRSSKAGLNAVVKSLSNDLMDRGIVATVMHPGWVRTDMGGEHAPLQVDEAAKGLADVMEKLTPAESGAFLDYTGAEVPW